MVVIKKNNFYADLVVSNTQIEKVTSYWYLGAQTSYQDREIRGGKETPWQAFYKMKLLLCCRNITFELNSNSALLGIRSVIVWG